MFQFLDGTIKSSESRIKQRLINSFNSSMVQLKADDYHPKTPNPSCFNSSMVQLKDYMWKAESPDDMFQFLDGTIKSHKNGNIHRAF